MSNTTLNNTSSVNLNLDKNKINRLIEALLFSTSVNIGAEWETNDYTEMLALAKELKHYCNNDIELNKICFYKEENYEDDWSQYLLKNFKKNIKTIKLEQV